MGTTTTAVLVGVLFLQLFAVAVYSLYKLHKVSLEINELQFILDQVEDDLSTVADDLLLMDSDLDEVFYGCEGDCKECTCKKD